ncbi:MAG: hypothetical protein Q8P05_06165 [Candidatus Diapherotrites archaeon]|nr:hypothetical protein [Candidatus Diapherotrites archaeon]MDZ4256827.1 hypothetical protein [archaeon]
MKQRLISISDEKDKLLTKLAMEKGGKKGAISATVEEALELLDKENRRKRAWKKAWELSNRDIDLGVGTFKRADLYKGKRFEHLHKIVGDSDGE